LFNCLLFLMSACPEFTRYGGGVFCPAGDQMLQLHIYPAVEIQVGTQFDPHRHVPMFTADIHVSKQVLIQSIHDRFLLQVSQAESISLLSETKRAYTATPHIMLTLISIPSFPLYVGHPKPVLVHF
jgi:hypothetical protein